MDRHLPAGDMGAAEGAESRGLGTSRENLTWSDQEERGSRVCKAAALVGNLKRQPCILRARHLASFAVGKKSEGFALNTGLLFPAVPL